MLTYHLAVDIGASSGRHILGHLDEKGKLVLEEVYRFPNGMVQQGGKKIWDVDRLFKEIKTGMKRCAEIGKIPVSMGIDTWGVDFVLLDAKGNRLTEAVGYRDSRTKGMDDEVYKIIPERELYARTGSQKQIYNTIYQLMALKKKEAETLKNADCLLLMPDYFHYRLTGVRAVEYTNATTTQLLDPYTRKWDFALIEELGYPSAIFSQIVEPGTFLGNLRAEVVREVGFDCKVILPGTHDTASAVAAVPADPDESVIYISSGTWSLIGTELREPNCSDAAWENNFANEGGYGSRYRFLKNIMGLWMIQSARSELAPKLSYQTICEAAAKETIASLVDCDDQRFLAPANMAEEIQKACRESGQEVPEGIAQIACVIYNSLAQCYKKAVEGLESITGKKYCRIYIMGGGSNAEYLNALTAKVTKRMIWAGPSEATALGNLIVQMLSMGEFADLREARKCIADSTGFIVYRE